jgi:hypothetical protein
MPIIKADAARVDRLLERWCNEVAPRVLIVTDSLDFEASNGLGLSHFVKTLRASPIHGMRPRVTTARFNTIQTLRFDPERQHVDNFRFTDPKHGVSRSNYDVVFLIANNTVGDEKELQLRDEPGALEAITSFMQKGGGLFATGDHAELGAGMCLDVPRVRSMRHWKLGDTPSAGGTDRLSTLVPGRGDVAGSNDVYELSDQSDPFPQTLYVNFTTRAARPPYAGVRRLAHPVLQVGATRAIEVFPDHPNEGECVIPTDLETRLPDGEREWPLELGDLPAVSPELVALSMSHGNGTAATCTVPVRLALAPRSFIAIAAYDGHRCGVGRVVTDSSYHHFVNDNVRPGTAEISGRDLTDIERYFTNLATWLLPRDWRRRQRQPWLIRELTRGSLFHEFPAGLRAKLDAARAHELGALLQEALLGRYNAADVHELMDDALEDAIGLAAKRKLEALGDGFGRLSASDAALSALGAFALAVAQRFNELAREAEVDVDVERAFAGTEKAGAAGAKLYLASARGPLRQLGELLDAIGS